MLSERSPPEGQEDPPGSKSSSTTGPVDNKTSSSSASPKGVGNTQDNDLEKLKSDTDVSSPLQTDDEKLSSSTVRCHAYINDKSPAQSSNRATPQTPASKQIYIKEDKFIICDDIEVMSEDDNFTCDEVMSDDLDEEGDDGDDEDNSEDIPEDSCIDNDSVLETDLNDEDISQLTTDVDQCESSSSSSTGNSATDVEAIRRGRSVCLTDDEEFHGTSGHRSAGVGVETVSNSSDGGSTDEDCEETDVGTSDVLTATSFHRQPIPMEESMLSLDEVAEPEEEALTEGCREKTSIVGGSKWDELMGGMGGAATLVEDKVNKQNMIENNTIDFITQSTNLAVTTVIPFAKVPGGRSSLIDVEPVTVSIPFTTSVSTNFISSMSVETPAEKFTTLVADMKNIEDLTNSSRAQVLEDKFYVGLNDDSINEPIPESFVPNNEMPPFLNESDSADRETDSFNTEKYIPPSVMTRTLSLSSVGSKSGMFDNSKFDNRSDGKLSSILDCKLDSTSQSVVAALDDAAREAQLQLLNLHTQLQLYRKMAARKKARKVIDDKVNTSLKYSILALKIPLGLPKSLPLQLYPLKHEDVNFPGCIECEAQEHLERSCRDSCIARHSLAASEASQNVLTTALFRRPGEKLYKVFMMREGHARGVPVPVRVVLSSHALYVLNTCPAPSLLHALPYTRLHTLVLGGFSDWVILLSRGDIESGSEGRGYLGVADRSERGTKSNNVIPTVVGIQLCGADPDFTLEFVACLELQARRALMSVMAGEIRQSLEHKLNNSQNISNTLQTDDEKERFAKAKSRSDTFKEDLSCSSNQSGNLYDAWMGCEDQLAGSSKVSTPQEWRRPQSSITSGPRKQLWLHASLSDSIEHLVPGVVEAGEWERLVLRQWLQYLLPSEVWCSSNPEYILF